MPPDAPCCCVCRLLDSRMGPDGAKAIAEALLVNGSLKKGASLEELTERLDEIGAFTQINEHREVTQRTQLFHAGGAGKPPGVWFGLGASWIRWCAQEMPSWLRRDRYVYGRLTSALREARTARGSTRTNFIHCTLGATAIWRPTQSKQHPVQQHFPPHPWRRGHAAVVCAREMLSLQVTQLTAIDGGIMARQKIQNAAKAKRSNE
eukprot:CAMPEP_0115847288 /NCGR_PEP_ID=MMETSP0287-20121206/10305_1 /TAXON_ID=412157 /ORGANISM="Chrysochromulina rotalis, Strain UIO044" /LENGTH=205 /DNA_ID=CAMNT_0003301117 /DNA_START=13 /DNA_END=631 /DNA_ORIENTATION=-